MSDYDIDPGVPAAIERFKLPETLGFGLVNAPVMFDAEWRDGRWERDWAASPAGGCAVERKGNGGLESNAWRRA